MTKRFKPPAPGKLPDETAERIRRVQDERVKELQAVPIVGGKLVKDIVLEPGVETAVAHGLGRRASIIASPARGEMTGELLIPAAAMSPTSAANWLHPNGTADYWEYSAGANQLLHVPLTGLVQGMRITSVRLSFYRGAANNPTITLYAALAAAAATAQTPTVAWTNPSASTTWEVLEASYDLDVIRANWYLLVDAANAGDRVRAAYVTIAGPLGTVTEVRSTNYDPTKYSVLKASGYGGNVTVDAWCF